MAQRRTRRPAAFRYPQTAFGSFLRQAHRALLVEWLSAPLETRARDFEWFLRILDREDTRRIGQMLRTGDYSALLPPDLEPVHRNHFAIEVGALLPLLSIEILSMPADGNSAALEARFS